jgi:hypothetical protein
LLLGLKTSPRIASASASVFAAGGDQMGENRPRRHRGDAGVNKSMARAVTGVVISLFVLLGAGHAAAATSSDASDVKKLAVDVTWAGIRAQYGRVWPWLHPKYQRATTRAFWESCQRKRAAKTPGVEWISIDAIDAYPDRVALPLLGTINVDGGHDPGQVQLPRRHTHSRRHGLLDEGRHGMARPVEARAVPRV